jgi:hypothetical protein
LKAKPGTDVDRNGFGELPLSCSTISLNKPTSVTDAKGNQTSFTYDPTMAAY